jgi:hypothetical protein
MVAITTAREVGRLSLEEALELLILIAKHDQALFRRASVRWLERVVQERPGLEIGEAALIVGNLSALPTRVGPVARAALRQLAATLP